MWKKGRRCGGVAQYRAGYEIMKKFLSKSYLFSLAKFHSSCHINLMKLLFNGPKPNSSSILAEQRALLMKLLTHLVSRKLIIWTFPFIDVNLITMNGVIPKLGRTGLIYPSNVKSGKGSLCFSYNPSVMKIFPAFYHIHSAKNSETKVWTEDNSSDKKELPSPVCAESSCDPESNTACFILFFR